MDKKIIYLQASWLSAVERHEVPRTRKTKAKEEEEEEELTFVKSCQSKRQRAFNTTETMYAGRPAFLDQQAPKGYIAGIGRGAVGFDKNQNLLDTKRLPKRLQNEQLLNRKTQLERFQDLEEGERDEQKTFDEIDQRRLLKKGINSGKNSHSDSTSPLESSTNDFADLKKNLSLVSDQEWLNLPEATDLTRRNKRLKVQDTENRKVGYVVDVEAVVAGAGAATTTTLARINEERELLLGKQLDHALSSSGRGIEETKTEKSSAEETLRLLEAADSRTESEIEKTRKMLQLYIKSDSLNPSGWIALTRLEESCKKFKTAKKIIQQACTHIPYNVDLWMENIRLYETTDIPKCQQLTKQALKYNFKEQKIWVKAISLESDRNTKIKLIRTGLMQNPAQEELWKLSIEFEENKQEALKMVEKALEYLPKSIYLWIALYKLRCETNNVSYSEKKQLLGRILTNVPNSKTVWVLACQLEEYEMKLQKKPESNIRMALNSLLEKNDYKGDDVEEWITEAETCSAQDGYPLTTASIIRLYMILQNFTKPDPSLLAKFQKFETKSLIFEHFLVQEKSLSLWSQYYRFGKNSGYLASVFKFWRKHIENLDNAFDFPNCVLLYCKYNSSNGNFEKATSIIEKLLAVKDNRLTDPLYEKLMLANIKILLYQNLRDSADVLFSKLVCNERKRSLSSRVAYKYIAYLLYKKSDYELVLERVDKFIAEYPQEIKLYLEKLQILKEEPKFSSKFEQTIRVAKKLFPTQVEFWLYECAKAETYMSSKIVLDQAIIYFSKLPSSKINGAPMEKLYIQKAQIEIDYKSNLQEAKIIIQQALLKYPKSELLYSYFIRIAARLLKPQELKNLFARALKQTENSALILLQIGLQFIAIPEKALKWIDKALIKDQKLGDAWCWKYKLSPTSAAHDILDKVQDAEPNHGDLWVAYSKKNTALRYEMPKNLVRTVAAELVIGKS